jgi:uncharacterized membrane protein YjfL (UPF0719 family)
MNTNLFFLGLLQLVLSAVMGSLILYFTYSALQRWLRGPLGITPDNQAAAVLTAGILFSVGYITSGATQPLLATLRLLSGKGLDTGGLMLEGGRYLLLFVGVAAVAAALVNVLSIQLYTRLTRHVDEMAEVARDNQAVGLMMAAVVVVVALFVRDGVGLLLESLVPYPQLPGPLVR